MIQTAETLVGNLTNLAIGAAVLIAIGMILWSWLIKRTVSSVIGVIILAAVVLFAVNATGWLQDRIAEDVGATAPPTQTVVANAPPTQMGVVVAWTDSTI